MGGLYSNCNSLPLSVPLNYKDFQECEKEYRENYFIGRSKIIGIDDDVLVKSRALEDLISLIATSVVSDMDASIVEKTITVDKVDQEEKVYQFEDYVIQNLQTKSEAYIMSPEYRRFEIDKHDFWYVFKKKSDFFDETKEMNVYVEQEARDFFEIWKESLNVQYLFKAYILVRSISGHSSPQDNSTLVKILDLKNEIDQHFDFYINGLEFEVKTKNIEVTLGELNTTPIEVKVNLNLDKIDDLDKRDIGRAFPGSVNIVLEGTAKSTYGWKRTELGYMKEKAINSRSFNLKIGTITSSLKTQFIYFYPSVARFSGPPLIDSKIESERRELERLLQDKSTNGSFGEGLILNIDTRIPFSYNKDEIKYKLASLDFDSKEYSKIFNKIESSINQNSKFVYDSENQIKFFAKLDLNNKRIKFESDEYKEIFSVKYREIKQSWNSRNFFDSEDLVKIEKPILRYIQKKEKQKKEITINCKICNDDNLVYYTRKDKSNPIKLKKGLDSFTIEKGSLHKIELRRDNFTYLTINDNELLDSDRENLFEIVNAYLIKNKAKNNAYSKVLDGEFVCFPDEEIVHYKLDIPNGYTFDDFKIKWNNKVVKDKYLLSSKYIDANTLFIEKDGFKIGKKIRGQSISDDYTYRSLSLSPNFSFKNSINIALQVKKAKISFSDILIPGVSNFTFFKAKNNSAIIGFLKMFTFSLLANNIYQESIKFNDSKNLYENSKSNYENKLDGSQEEYTMLFNQMKDDYDQMIEHQNMRNASLVLLGGLYGYNTFELLKIRFKL